MYNIIAYTISRIETEAISLVNSSYTRKENNYNYGDQFFYLSNIVRNIVRNPVFGVSHQARHKTGCTAIEDH